MRASLRQPDYARVPGAILAYDLETIAPPTPDGSFPPWPTHVPVAAGFAEARQRGGEWTFDIAALVVSRDTQEADLIFEAARRTLFRDDDADAEMDEQGLGHPDRRVDFTIRPVSEEWRLVGRKPAYRTARANVQYIWRDSVGNDRLGAMPRWFGERTYDLRSSGLLLPGSAPQWAATGYELWDRIDAATAATGDPTEVSAWHILAELPFGLDESWWEWLATNFAERNLVRLGAPVAYAVHALAAPDGGWAIAPHVHMVVPARRFRSGVRHGHRMPSWAGCWGTHDRLERAWRTACGLARVKGGAAEPFMIADGVAAEAAIFRRLARTLKPECTSAPHNGEAAAARRSA